MGYLLPVQPIQSQQYANRMENASNSFAYIENVPSVKLQSEYEQWQKRLRRRQDEQQEMNAEQREFGKAERNQPPLSPAKKGFIQPNPVKLSKEVAAVVGKGIAVNEYV